MMMMSMSFIILALQCYRLHGQASSCKLSFGASRTLFYTANMKKLQVLNDPFRTDNLKPNICD